MDLLRAIQGDHLHSPVAVPLNGQPLALVFKTLSFAKQRFDSTADPVAKLALMLVPVATLLAYIGSDMRHETDKRDRARVLLRRFNAKFCTALGLSADWSLTCQAFLRLFDQANHDIAKSKHEVETLIATLDALFIKSRVWLRQGAAAAGAENLPAIGSFLRFTEAKPLFITHYVQKQLQTRYVFRCGGSVIQPWGPITQADQIEMSSRMHHVAKTAIARLRTDFPADAVREYLSVFDCAHSLPHMARETGDPQKRTVLQNMAKLAKALGYQGEDLDHAVLEYRDASRPLLAAIADGQPLATSTNVEVWSQVLRPQFVVPGRIAPLRVLPKIVRFYIAIEDGECQVERDFAAVRFVMDQWGAQVGGSRCAPLLDDVTVLRSMGPTTAEALVDPATGGLGHFSRACAQMWRDAYCFRGGRLGCSGGKRDLKRKRVTWATVKRGVMKAAAGATQAEATLRSSPAAAVCGAAWQTHAVFNGASHAALKCPGVSLAGTAASPFHTKAFHNFTVATQNKVLRTSSGTRIKSMLIRRKPAAARPTPLANIRTVAWLPAPPPGATSTLPRQEGSKKCLHADLVITDALWKLSCAQTLSGDKSLLVDLIYMMATCKPLVTAATWALADGQSDKVPATNIVRHKPVQVSCEFSFDFAHKYWDVVAALQKCAGLPAGTWKVKQTAAGVNTLLELAEKLLLWRQCDNVIGPKLWTNVGATAL